MLWYTLQFTHYSGDDISFDNFTAKDFNPIHAGTLSEALHHAASPVYGPHVPPLARIDSSDSPYGGVFTLRQHAGHYFQLHDFVRDTLPVFAVFAAGVFKPQSASVV